MWLISDLSFKSLSAEHKFVMGDDYYKEEYLIVAEFLYSVQKKQVAKIYEKYV